MQPLSGMSVSDGNTGLQARIKLDTRNAQGSSVSAPFKPLVSHKKTPNFHKGIGRKDTALPTCPNNDLGIGHDPCGRSRGSGLDD